MIVKTFAYSSTVLETAFNSFYVLSLVLQLVRNPTPSGKFPSDAKKNLFDTYSSAASYCQLELQTKNIRTFHNHGKGPY